MKGIPIVKWLRSLSDSCNKLKQQQSLWHHRPQRIALTTTQQCTKEAVASFMHPNFQILQYNTHKSQKGVMATFLRDSKVLEADVIAVQEPWRNEISDTTHQPAKATHQLVYPGKNEQGTARVCMFISKRIDTASWSHSVVSQDYQILKISHHRGE